MICPVNVLCRQYTGVGCNCVSEEDLHKLFCAIRLKTVDHLFYDHECPKLALEAHIIFLFEFSIEKCGVNPNEWLSFNCRVTSGYNTDNVFQVTVL